MPREQDNEAYEERAAIMEYCAGLPRAEAERLAARRHSPQRQASEAARRAIEHCKQILMRTKE